VVIWEVGAAAGVVDGGVLYSLLYQVLNIFELTVFEQT